MNLFSVFRERIAIWLNADRGYLVVKMVMMHRYGYITRHLVGVLIAGVWAQGEHNVPGGEDNDWAWEIEMA